MKTKDCIGFDLFRSVAMLVCAFMIFMDVALGVSTGFNNRIIGHLSIELIVLVAFTQIKIPVN